MKIRNKEGQFCTAQQFWDELLGVFSEKLLSVPSDLGTVGKPNPNFMKEILKFEENIFILRKTCIREEGNEPYSCHRIDKKGVFYYQCSVEHKIAGLKEEYKKLVAMVTTTEVEDME